MLPLTGVITDAATGTTRKVFRQTSLCPAFITVNGTYETLTKVYGGLHLDVLSNLVWSHAPVELQDQRLLRNSSALGLCDISNYFKSNFAIDRKRVKFCSFISSDIPQQIIAVSSTSFPVE